MNKMNKFSSKFLMRLSLRDRLLFIKQLAVLIKAGVPLFESLNLLKEHATSKTSKKILDQIIKDVEHGQSLTTALQKFKKVFGELSINIIAVGEMSGTLSNNLGHLAVTLKKSHTLQRKVIGALVYPVFIIIATLAITIVLLVFVFPKIIPVLKSIHYKLPWTTQAVIFTSDLFKYYWPLIMVIIMALAIGIWFLFRVEKIRFWRDTIIAKTLFIKQTVQAYNTANICRTMGLLLTSGVSVVDSFKITSDTTANLAYKKELADVAQGVAKGETMCHQLKRTNLFPLTMVQMVKVAESTGKLSETFLYISDIYQEDMDELIKSLSNSIEPLLLIFMGLLVGFIAISIITPIYGITQHLSPK